MEETSVLLAVRLLGEDTSAASSLGLARQNMHDVEHTCTGTCISKNLKVDIAAAHTRP